MFTNRRAFLRTAALATAAITTAALAACGSDDTGDTTTPVSADQVQAALDKGGQITVWAWEPTLKQAVAAFEGARFGLV